MKILVISGVHGNEVSAVNAGMIIADKFRNDIEVRVIPWANKSGLFAGTRDMQITNTKDLNRCFAKEEEDYVSIIKREIEYADAVIDIHNSTRCGHFALIDKGHHCNYISNICEEAGVVHASRYSNGGTIKDYTNSLYKIGITYEFPGMSNYQNEYNINKAVEDITKLINTLKTQDKNPRAYPMMDNTLQELYCTQSGMIKLYHDVNSLVPKGSIVLEIVNELGSVLETIFNPTDHTIRILAVSETFVKKGTSCIMYI